jgi:hypothetical protein
MLYPHSHLPEAQLRDVVAAMPAHERERVVDAYVGRADEPPPQARPGARAGLVPLRRVRRLRRLPRPAAPPHAHDRVAGAQPRHGYDTPTELVEAGVEAEWHEALERQAGAVGAAAPRPAAAGAVRRGVRLAAALLHAAQRPRRHADARAAHPAAGPPAYRRVCQRMHDLIRDEAGHPAVAAMMRFVDHSTTELERLEAEQAPRRAAPPGGAPSRGSGGARPQGRR